MREKRVKFLFRTSENLLRTSSNYVVYVYWFSYLRKVKV